MAPSPYCCPCAFSKLHPQQKSWSLPTQMRTGASTENLTSLAAMLMSFQPFIFIPRSAVSCVSKHKAVEALGRCQPTFGACTLAGLPLLRRRAPDRHGRGVDYSIALVERLSAFFIMLIGFEWVRPRLTPGTRATFPCGFLSAIVLAHFLLGR